MEDEGEVTDLLNIEISRQGASITLIRQTAYIDKITREWFSHGPPAHVQLNSVPHPEDIRELVIHATGEGAAPADPTLMNKYTANSWALYSNTRPPQLDRTLHTQPPCYVGRCPSRLTNSSQPL